MRLTSPDEYFHHQAALPHAMAGSSDPSWRERYWISIQDTAGSRVLLRIRECPGRIHPSIKIYM